MPVCPILIGREAELQQLTAFLDGPGGVVTVSGEAGLGKSRLVRETAALARDRGRPVVWGRPEEVSAPGPFSLIVDLLDNLAAGTESAAHDARELIEDLVAPPATPGSLSRHVAARLRGILGQLAARPMVILEDLHSVDDASLNVAFHLARSASDDGRIVIGTYRPEGVTPATELGRVLAVLEKERSLQEVRLFPLGPDETRRIVAEVLGREPDSDVLATISRLGEGVPFFIEELTSITAAGGLLPELPQSITRAIAQQLSRLQRTTLELVQVAALIEGPSDLRVLIQATGSDSQAIRQSLDEALAAGLLEEHEGHSLFRHTIVRRAVLSLIHHQDLQGLHRKIALALEGVFGRDTSRSWQLAIHWHEADNQDKASNYAMQAGRHALGLAATSDAQRAFEAAQEWSRDVDMQILSLEGQTAVAFREGRERDAADLARRVVSSLRDVGRTADAAAALGRLALVLTRVDDVQGAEQAIDEGLQLLDDGRHPEILARLSAQKGNFLIFYQDRFADAEALIVNAIEEAKRIGSFEIMAVAGDGLAEIASWRGRFAEADRIGDETLTWATQSQNPEAIGRTYNNYAVRLALHGRPQLGLHILSVGRDLVSRTFGAAGVSSLDITRAWVHQIMGEPGNALESLKNLESVWLACRGLAGAIRTWALLERGELAEADVVLTHAWREAGFAGGWRMLADEPNRATPDVTELLPATVWFYLASGRFPEAAGAAQLHQASSKKSGQSVEWARSAALLARALALGGEGAGASRALASLADQLRERPYPYLIAWGREVEGLIARNRDQSEQAAEFFSSAAELFASCSNSSEQARCHRAVAEMIQKEPTRAAEAKERLTRARELAMRAGALSELSQVEASLRRIGVRPRAGRPRKSNSALVGQLTAREEQIAALVAEGATNTEIARRLFISDATVAGYVSTSMRKLGLGGRAALAAWSARAGLV